MGATSKDLGWQNSQTLSPAYIRTLSLMEPGELSSIFRDPKGFHILKLVEQRGGNNKQTKARVRHILIPETDPQAKLKATQVRNKILAGEDFAKLAKEMSADKGSAEKGGELPLANPAAYVPPFAAAVTTLPLNSLSEPVQTQFGWHIIEVLDRQKVIKHVRRLNFRHNHLSVRKSRLMNSITGYKVYVMKPLLNIESNYNKPQYSHEFYPTPGCYCWRTLWYWS